MNDQKRILIVRPDRIGDVVLSTPIPQAIKKTYPNSFVAVLVRDYTQDIFKHNPFVDKIILADKNDPFLKKVFEIRSNNFTHSLSLLPTEKLNYLLFVSGIKTRIGVGHKFYQAITNTKSVFRRKYEQSRHEADYCMDTARKIGVETSQIEPEIYLSNDEKAKVSEIRSKLLGNKKFLIGIHSTSGNSAPNLKLAEYLRLAKNFETHKEFAIAITDNSIPGIFNDHQEFLYPNISKSLRESFLTFAALDILISASTGPMHIAAALKIKTVSLFCPLPACSPKLWGPLGNNSKVILPSENYCQTQCPGDPKKCSFEGEGGINTKMIENSVLSVLNPQ